MITLHTNRTESGEIAIALHKENGAVGYFKDGTLQTLMDTQGRNLAPHLDAAVEVLSHDDVREVLVLGHGGGAASSMLHRAGLEVTTVDRDPRTVGLARLFFRAPPCLKVLIREAEAFVAEAQPATFDGALVDIQDSPITPSAYLSPAFWTQLVRVPRPGSLVLVNVIDWLYLEPDWPQVRVALNRAGLDSIALSDRFASGNRLLVTATSTARDRTPMRVA